MLSHQLAAAGQRRVGIDVLFGKLRWDTTISTTDKDYKIPNDHKPFYARLIMDEHESLAGLFELRRAEADSWIAEKKAS